jgi:hypothetical protein
MTDWMAAPKLMIRTVMPESLARVISSTSRPSGMRPNTARLTSPATAVEPDPMRARIPRQPIAAARM